LKKNVIVILIDGARLDYTKNSIIFNKLKTKSVYFTQNITYAPYTNAAMHAFISGCYGNRNGTYSYWHSDEFKNDKFKTLTNYLKDEGYFTCFDGHSDLILPKLGFDEYHIHDENTTNLINSHNELLEKMKTHNENRENFFLYLHYSQIHAGIMNEVLKVYTNFSREYFDNRDLNEKRYTGFFKAAENYLQSILDKINSLQLDKNSVILVMSDHGISIGEKFGEKAYGAFCYDYTIKTFAYLLDNGLQPKEINTQVRTVDFMPTILDYIGVKLDDSFAELDGESLLSLIKNEKKSENIAYSETGNPLKSKAPPKSPNTKCVRTSQWKLIVNEYNNTKELYDLKSDPDEEKNLINKKIDIEEILWKEFLKIQQRSEIPFN